MSGGTADEDALEAQATALLTAAEDDETEVGDDPNEPIEGEILLARGINAHHDEDENRALIEGHRALRSHRVVSRVVYVCVDVGGRELLKAEREFLTELGDLFLRRRMWFGGAGIGGSPWLTTRAGSFLERLHLRTEQPDARGLWTWVECRLAKKTRKSKGAK